MLYVNQNKLEHMLKLTTHTQVVDTIVKQVDTNKFSVIRNDVEGWCAITPKEATEAMPALCVHTDTVRNIHPTEIRKSGDIWTNADPSKLLGADDRAGCYIVKELLTRDDTRYMYLIFDEEETGGHGSSRFAITDTASDLLDSVSCFIGLDRKGLNEVALYGYESKEFLDCFHEDDMDGAWVEEIGSFTDASNLAGDLNRCCVNLSVGYNNEHTAYEHLNLSYLMVTLNRLNNGLSTALYGTHFIPDANPWGNWDDYTDKADRYYDEYRWDDTEKKYVSTRSADVEMPVFDDDDENFLPWCKDDEEDEFLRKGA